MAVVAMKQLLEAGVHFGHQTRRWDPRMAEYIFQARNGIHIIDLQKASKKIDEAYAFIKEQSEEGKTILFVGTKKQAQECVKEAALACGMYYIDQRWLGGMLTNFDTIQKRIQRLKDLEAMQEDGTFEVLPKKEVAKLKKDDTQMFGIVPVPQYISDVVYLPGHDIRYIRMEKVIMEYLELVFEKYEVSNKNYICVTRNADITPDDDSFDDDMDFRNKMKEVLHKRRRMAVVRFETAEPLDKETEKYFCTRLKIEPKQIFRTKMPMKLGFIFEMAEKVPEPMKRSLIDVPFKPQPSGMLMEGNITRQIKKKDALLFYPYETMDPFLQLVREASTDPNVLTIKITIYRLAKKARLVEYLCAAAENGKEVTVLIELRARFDEQNNIDWSERLEEAGCRVIYGMEGYKVHSKVCLITYRNRNDIEYITQIGTGNYNEKTAAMYTDLSLMTANRAIGEDAAVFFQNMSIGNLEGNYEHLIVAPVSLKATILRLMDEEIKKGKDGRIVMKMNSVTDTDFIEKLSEASKAGVKIDMIIRGICCVLPGVEKETENLSIMSIVGRYLEHARIFSFGTGSEQKIYIGSADMMTRNTEKRVEVACPIYDDTIRKEINHILKVMLSDNIKGRKLQNNGIYTKKEQKEPFINSQEVFMREAMFKGRSVKKKEEKTPFWKKLKKIWKR